MSATKSSAPADQSDPSRSDPAEVQLAQIERIGARIQQAHDAVAKVIFGQKAVIEESLITLLAGGHVLLIGVPGLAKTRLVQTLGTVLGLDDKRVQFTPDLMPADILGSEVLEEDPEGRRFFRFIPGPIFCQLLMADEINRASPRTQSALLQAMQEGHVSIAGTTHAIPRPFHVLATQNPIEQEGTYPLPEAQLDRFLMQVDIGYPDLAAEREIVLRPETSDVAEVRDQVAWGPGPRASQALMLASRARALLQGRLAPSVDDVIALARPVLQHRMALIFAARADGRSLAGLIDMLCARIDAA